MNTDNKFEDNDMELMEGNDTPVNSDSSSVCDEDNNSSNNSEENIKESDTDEGLGKKKPSDLGSFGFGPFGFGPGVGDVFGKSGYGSGYNRNPYDRNSYDRENRYDDRDSDYNRGPHRDNRGNGNNGNNGNNGGPNGNGKKGGSKLALLIFAAIITILMVYFMGSMYENATSEEISYNKFLTMLENGEVKSVDITSDGKITITPTEENTIDGALPKKTYWTTAISVDNLHEELKEAAKNHNVDFRADLSDSESTIVDILLAYVLPFILIYFLMGLLFKKMGKGGAMGVGKSKAKMYMEKETGVTFADVAGQDEAKESLKEIVDFLHNPDKYAKVGAKLPKGALLV